MACCLGYSKHPFPLSLLTLSCYQLSSDRFFVFCSQFSERFIFYFRMVSNPCMSQNLLKRIIIRSWRILSFRVTPIFTKKNFFLTSSGRLLSIFTLLRVGTRFLVVVSRSAENDSAIFTSDGYKRFYNLVGEIIIGTHKVLGFNSDWNRFWILKFCRTKKSLT